MHMVGDVIVIPKFQNSWLFDIGVLSAEWMVWEWPRKSIHMDTGAIGQFGTGLTLHKKSN